MKAHYEGKMFKRNWGWAAAGLLAVRRRPLARCAAVVVGDRRCRDLADPGVARQRRMRSGAAVRLAIQTRRRSGKCLLTIAACRSARCGRRPACPILVEALDHGLVAAAPARRCSACRWSISAFLWISAPTKEGRAVLDQIAGFKQYLSITERERLDRMHAARGHAGAVRALSALCDRAGRREPLGRPLRRRARGRGRARGSRASPGIRASSSPWNDPGGFVDSRWLVALQHDQLGIDRAGFEQRFRRRRIVGRRRRRWRRRRLVVRAQRPGAATPASARRDRCFRLIGSKPSRSASFIDGSFAGAMMAQIGVGSRLRVGPIERRVAGFGGQSLAMHLAAEDPAHLGLLAEFRLKIAPGGEQADIADQPAVALALDRPGAEAVELPARRPPPAVGASIPRGSSASAPK